MLGVQIEGVYRKNDREEKQRRQAALETRSKLEGQVPARWLKLPLTDAHARELRKLFREPSACVGIWLHIASTAAV